MSDVSGVTPPTPEHHEPTTLRSLLTKALTVLAMTPDPLDAISFAEDEINSALAILDAAEWDIHDEDEGIIAWVPDPDRLVRDSGVTPPQQHTKHA